HGADVVHARADAALSRAAAARADLRAGRSLHAARLPAAVDRAGVCAGPREAAWPRPDQRLAAPARRGRGVPGRVHAGAVALRAFPDDRGGEELAVRRPSHAVLAGSVVPGAVVPDGSVRSDRTGTAVRPRDRIRLRAVWFLVGQLDVPSAAVRLFTQ